MITSLFFRKEVNSDIFYNIPTEKQVQLFCHTHKRL